MSVRAAEPGRAKVRRRALFTDRDGTLNPDLHYLKDAERLELFRGVADGVALARRHGYLVICVTNQSGIERGLYTREDVERIHRRLNERLRREGTEVDAFYYCPHAPERHCACRKPGTQLFEDAQKDWNLEMSSSAIVGDRGLDVEAGQRLGLLTALVPSRNPDSDSAREAAQDGPRAEIVAGSFENAVLRVLARG